MSTTRTTKASESATVHRLWSLAVGLITVAIGASGHFYAHTAWLDRLNTPPSPNIPDAPIHEPIAVETPRRLWVVIVDGLGYDRAEGLPNLRRVAEEGSSAVLMADFPSYTYPGITTFSTGVTPRFSGVRLNAEGVHSSLDSLSKAASRAGWSVAISHGGFDPLVPLLGPPHDFKLTDVDTLLGHAPAEHQLAWIYFGDVDAMGHRNGADTTEYKEAAHGADVLVGRLAAELDPTQDALVILSEHGHLDGGGHGGIEPASIRALFVAWGGPFASDTVLAEILMRDVAPTLATAMGIAPPRSAMGRAVAPVFGLAASPRESSPDLGLALVEGGLERLFVAGLLWVLVFVCLVLGHRRRWFELAWRDAVPTVVYTLVFAITYAISGNGLSWSIPHGSGGFMIETALGAGIAAAAAVWSGQAARRREEALALTLCLGLPFTLLGAYLGTDTQKLPDPWTSFAFILVATAIFYPGLVLGVRALVRRRGGAQERPPEEPLSAL